MPSPANSARGRIGGLIPTSEEQRGTRRRRACAIGLAAVALMAIARTSLAQTLPTQAGQSSPVTVMPTVDTGMTAWMLTSTALVLLMVPGLAMFYGGLVRTKNVLGTMMHSFAAIAIVGVLWVICGYALSFGSDAVHGWVGWGWDLFLLQGLDGKINTAPDSNTGIPMFVFAMFQGKFAIITPALIAGAFAERVKFAGYCLYIAIWSLIVYCPLAHWVWSNDGFLHNWGPFGAIDYAGGTVVHISAGVSGLVAALYLGKRKGYPSTAMHPNNLVMTLMGAGLLWVGWFGFNAGSSLNSNEETARALTVTQAAAASGALMWMLIEALHHRKATSLGLVSGILAGLVAITPAAGVVQPGAALLLGAIASLVCYFSVLLKGKLGYDDSLDVFGIHGVAGILGALVLSGLIRHQWLADAAAKQPGWDAVHQLGVQAGAVALAVGYSAVVSFIILLVVQKTIGFRLDPVKETAGMDHSLHGESGYGLLNLD